MLAAWVAYPLILLALCVGVGLLVDVLAGRRLSGVLVAPAGLAAIVVVGQVTTATAATARLTVPAVCFLAVLGAGLSLPWWRFGRPDPWALGAALAIFVVFGAPVLCSGSPTFAGYIKLDDTATWLAITDRVIEHGRDLGGLAPSSYLATLGANLPNGYPVGVFIPFGAAQELSGGDLAWVFQPYLSFLAAMLALCLWEVLAGLLERPHRRALAVFVAAQPALLYGYAMWGGIKELAAAALVALAVALAPRAVGAEAGRREAALLALPAGALVGVLGLGGMVWVAPMLVALAFVGACTLGPREAARRASYLALALCLLVVPVVFSGGFDPFQAGLTGAGELGNLGHPLDPVQALGIWPSSDFRLDPAAGVESTVLIALGFLAAAVGLVVAWRRRALAPLLLASVVLAAFAVVQVGSPWVDGKALATVSPAVLALAIAGALAAVRVDRLSGSALVIAVAAGVIWSNVLAYGGLSLAPYHQLRELEAIGKEFAGQGPTLMTEYQPYGVRHFLRAADAEGASELRDRSIPLRGGGEAEKGEWVDTDQILLPGLLTYRTLVLRRNPGQSRPPSVYRLVRPGDYYDVWQRSASGGRIVSRLPLGDLYQPAAVPSCGQVAGPAAAAGHGGTVVAAPRGANVVATLSEGAYPAAWTPTGVGSPDLVPEGPGSVRIQLHLPASGVYDLYVQGSIRNPLSLSVDGAEVGTAGYQINENQQFLDLGRVRLAAGSHAVELTLDGRSAAPGSGGQPEPIGPLVASPVSAAGRPLQRLPADQATALCGRRLDWIEAIR